MKIEFNAESPDEVRAVQALAMTLGVVKGCQLTVTDTTVAPEPVPDEPIYVDPDTNTATGETTEILAPHGFDHNGVPFDPAFCGEAAEPFYSSGPRSGQWKKKRGVDEADYDKWYASHSAAPEEPAAPPPPPAPTSDCPLKDGGQLMHWIAERQAAGTLPQANIDAAYQQAGVTLNDLFPPNPPEAVQAAVEKLYTVLNV